MQRAEKSYSRDVERGFAARKHPRYYKSYAMTPSNDESSLVGEASQAAESIVKSRIPVSKGMQDFKG
jgi:hypothetical protein